MFLFSLLNVASKLYSEGHIADAKESLLLVPQVFSMQGEKSSLRALVGIAYFNLGYIAKNKEAGLYPSADFFSKALSYHPTLNAATYLKSLSLFELGYVDESLDVTAKSPPLTPFEIDPFAYRDYLLAEKGGYRMDPVTLESVRRRLMHINYSGTLSRDEITDHHIKWGRDVRAFLGPPVQHDRSGLDPEKRLRIGYISGDLRYHVVCFNIVPMLPHRNTEQTHTTLYYCGGLPEDEVCTPFFSFPLRLGLGKCCSNNCSSG
jgi:tetratricopeptide (TPR) repeat protein